MFRLRWSMHVGGVLLVSALLTGCAAPMAQFRYTGESAGNVLLPEPPETPRYQYIGELTGEQNFVAPVQEGLASAGGKVLRWLVGLGSHHHEPRVLQRPQSGVVDESGRVYVTDVSRQAVYVFDAAGGELQVGEEAGHDLVFMTPVGIALGAHDEILVADADLKRVVRLGKSGKPQGGFGEGILLRPTGIARDAVHGRVYVADTQAHDIKVFDDAGTLVTTLGKRGEQPGEFNAPTYLAFAGGKLIVADTLNARVQVLTPEGRPLQVLGGRGLYVGNTPRPKGVAVDQAGNIYVVESYYDYLLVFNNKGELLLPLGGSGSGAGQFYLPAGVWMDVRGRVYVADTFNGRVVVFQFLGGVDETRTQDRLHPGDGSDPVAAVHG